MARSDLTADELARLVGDDDLDGIFALLEGATDRDRSRARPFLEAAIESHAVHGEPQRAYAAVILGTGTAAHVATYQYWWRYGQAPLDEETVAKLIGDRSERFRRSLLPRLLKGRFTTWSFIDGLLRHGVLHVDPSTDEAYLRVFFEYGQGIERADSDQSLLQAAVPAVLRTPGIVGWYTGESWIGAIAGWVDDGRLDRDATIDATLSSLLIDLAPNELRWFATLLRQLEPSKAELAVRQDATLGLVSASRPEVIKLGLELAGQLQNTELVDEVQLIGHLRSPLTGQQKNLAMMALALLDALATGGRSEDTRAMARLGIVEGLTHPRPDVGRRSLDLIRRHLDDEPDERLRIALADIAPLAAPTLRAAASELAGTTSIEPREADSAVAATVGSDGRRPNVYVEPIGPRPDLDEVVAIFIAALEGEGTADDLERAIAAALDMGEHRPTGFADLVSPLRKRAGELGGAVAVIVRAWVDPASGPTELRSWCDPITLVPRTGDRREHWQRLETPGSSWQWRAHEIAFALASQRPQRAWAEPTDRDGGIAATTMAERREAHLGLGLVDHQWARLRDRDMRGEVTVASWRIVTLDRSRHLDVTFDIGPALVDEVLIRVARDLLVPNETTHWRLRLPWWWWNPDSRLTSDLFLSLFRNVSAIPIALAASALLGTVDTIDSAPFSLLSVLHLAGESGTPMDGTCPLLLVLAITQGADLRAAATDALAAGVIDGRIEPELVADAAAQLHDAERLVLTRLADPLTELAAMGGRERRFAQQFMLGLVARIGGARPNGLHALLEVLAQSCVGGVDIPGPARAVLQDLSRRQSKAGRSAREVLEMDNTNR